MVQHPVDLEENLLVVLVVYEMKINESTAFNSLCKASLSRLITFFIYDNSKYPQSISIENWPRIYCHDPSNPGVSKAYNEGYKMAKGLNRKWLLLADQDTDFSANVFSDYSNAINNYSDVRVFAPALSDLLTLVSPFQLVWGKGRRIRETKPGRYSFEKYKIINSGTLISLEAFENAGGYDERFPLDYSDISFSDRLVVNDPNFVLITSWCKHNLSATNKKKDLSMNLARFKSFCHAVRLYKKISNRLAIVPWIVLPRALRLSFEMRNINFLKIAFTK
jgi:GT2 family glycosyltransferase